MARWWSCVLCEAKNDPSADKCEACGALAPSAARAPSNGKPATSRQCDCGGTLDARGFCARGNGYPLTMGCPFVCPLCRYPLAWSGQCQRCYGDPSGARRRDHWAIVGDRYEPEDQHWRMVQRGQCPAATHVENTLGLADCGAALGGMPFETTRPPARIGGANDTWFEQFQRAGLSRRGRGR